MKINSYKIRLTIAGIVGILSILAVCGLFYPIKFMHIQFTTIIHRLFHDYTVQEVVIVAGSLSARLIITLHQIEVTQDNFYGEHGTHTMADV